MSVGLAVSLLTAGVLADDLGTGLGTLLAGLVEGRAGWSAGPVALLACGLALLAVFVVVQARRAAPLVDLALFRVRGFTAATLGALVAGVGVVGVVSYVPTVLQRGLGASLPSVMMGRLTPVWRRRRSPRTGRLRGAPAPGPAAA